MLYYFISVFSKEKLRFVLSKLCIRYKIMYKYNYAKYTIMNKTHLKLSKKHLKYFPSPPRREHVIAPAGDQPSTKFTFLEKW